MIDKIFKTAKLEAEWIKYYGHAVTRLAEPFDDINFYDRILPIGYSKVYTPLHIKCNMGCVNTLESNPEVVNGIRNHSKSVYTCLEYVIHNKIEGYLNLIQIIKS